jgi:FolB domain-containing protein
MDKIIVRDLLVRGILGVKPEERTKRQDILVNLELEVDTRPAAASDDITDAVNYRSIAKRVIERVEGGSDRLVERLCEDLARLILTEFPVRRIRLRVDKPGALRFARSVGVEIERSAEELTPPGR